MAELAALVPIMQTVATIATIASTAVAAAGTIAAGRNEKAAAEYQAQQLDVAAKEEQAAAGVEAEQLRRKKELALSGLQSDVAASGFSTTDPTALNLAEDIERYGTVQEQMAMYGGASRREGLQAQARAARMTGKAQQQASLYRAGATILSGVTTIADRYRPRSTDADRYNPNRQGGTAAPSPYHYGYR